MAPMITRCAIALSVLAVAIACGTREAVPSGPAATTRDSAGVTIVENTTPAWTPATAWRIDSTPVFDVGGSDTDSTRQFARILGVHRMSDGSVAVMDATSWSLRFFDAKGNPTIRAGRRGQGPGEFYGDLRQSLSCGDTVFVDVGYHLTAYTRTGQFVGNVKLAPGGKRVARAVFCSPSGLIGRVGSSVRTNDEVQTSSLELAWYDFDGRLRAVIDTFVATDWMCAPGPEGLGCAVMPFSRRFAVIALGRDVATPHHNDRQIDVRDSTGAVKRIIRLSGGAQRVTEADIARYRDYVLPTISQQGNANEVRAMEARLSASKLPSTMPWIGDMRGDGDGGLWVREYDFADMVEFFDSALSRRTGVRAVRPAIRKWTVFDSTGRLMGDVALPQRFDVWGIGRDWILGIWRDDLDVEHVRIYRIVKP
jgi:hypothetical protein